MSKGGRFASNNGKHPKKRKSGLQIALTVIVVVLVLVVAGMIGFVVYNTSMERMSVPSEETSAPTEVLEETEEETEETTVETTEETTVPTTLPYVESGKDIINILVVGQSGRTGETAEAAKYADTSILVTVNKATKTMTLTSILRDAWVNLPNYVDPNGTKHTCGWNRINTAYALGYMWGDTGGAMQMMNECLYNNFGVEVDYNIEVDFEGFIAVIDAMGGVEIEITEAEANYLNKDDLYVYEDVEPGLVKMNGMTALSYARMRKASGDGDSDIKRTERQRKMIMALLDQVMGMEFSEMRGFARYLMSFVTTNMTAEEITTCLWEILPLLTDLTIETGTCPVETTYWGEMEDIGGYPASVLKFSQSQNTKLMQAITEGIPAE